MKIGLRKLFTIVAASIAIVFMAGSASVTNTDVSAGLLLFGVILGIMPHFWSGWNTELTEDLPPEKPPEKTAEEKLKEEYEAKLAAIKNEPVKEIVKQVVKPKVEYICPYCKEPQKAEHYLNMHIISKHKEEFKAAMRR